MTWFNGMSDTERTEMYGEICAAYQAGHIGRISFIAQLGKLRYSATDIADAEKFYRPEPPEDED